jgi:hypothetical protein
VLTTILLIPALAGWWMLQQRAEENALLREASIQMKNGLWEEAGNTLGRLRGRPLLSGATRRLGAELYFRLGEDRAGHQLLFAQRYDAKHADDVRLKALAASCGRAARLVEQAKAQRSPAERLALAREARKELPESPRVLQFVVREELLGSVDESAPAVELDGQFERDYAQLRIAAPTLADEVRREAESLAAREQR